MREIKFRAWDKGNFEMFTYDNIGDVIFGLENDSTVSLFICDSEESPNVDVMQFTGLLDKNGVEIYEGDIVKCVNNHIGLVEWESNDCCFNVADYYDSSNDYPIMAFMEGQPFEVIGNIHENPELLENDNV